MTELRCTCGQKIPAPGRWERITNPECPLHGVHGGEPPVADPRQAILRERPDLDYNDSGEPHDTNPETRIEPPEQPLSEQPVEQEPEELRCGMCNGSGVNPEATQACDWCDGTATVMAYLDGKFVPAERLREVEAENLRLLEGVDKGVRLARYAETQTARAERAEADRDEAWRETLRLKKALEHKGDVAEFDVEVLRAERDEARKEAERLRTRTHEIQEAADKRNASLQKAVDNYRNAFARAREMVKDVKADWTTDPPSQGDYGFWRYTSQNTTDTLAYMASQIIEAEQSRDQLREALRGTREALALAYSIARCGEAVSVGADKRISNALAAAREALGETQHVAKGEQHG